MMQTSSIVSSHNSGSGVNVAEICLASHKCIYCGRFNVVESWIHGSENTKVNVQVRTSFGFHGELMLGGRVVEEFVDDLPVGKVGICDFCDSFSLDSLKSVVVRNQKNRNAPTDWTPLRSI